MTTTFGNKKVFAIEYKVNDINSMMGNARIWIDDLPIGNFEEEAPLLSIQHALNKASKRLDQLESKLLEKQKENQNLHHAFLTIPDNGKFMISLGETFDDFSIFVFKNVSSLHFLWKLFEDSFFEYPNYPAGLHLGIVDATYFVKIVDEADKFLQSKKIK